MTDPYLKRHGSSSSSVQTGYRMTRIKSFLRRNVYHWCDLRNKSLCCLMEVGWAPCSHMYTFQAVFGGSPKNDQFGFIQERDSPIELYRAIESVSSPSRVLCKPDLLVWMFNRFWVVWANRPHKLAFSVLSARILHLIVLARTHFWILLWNDTSGWVFIYPGNPIYRN